jgi:hypothetical protein
MKCSDWGLHGKCNEISFLIPPPPAEIRISKVWDAYPGSAEMRISAVLRYVPQKIEMRTPEN